MIASGLANMYGLSFNLPAKRQSWNVFLKKKPHTCNKRKLTSADAGLQKQLPVTLHIPSIDPPPSSPAAEGVLSLKALLLLEYVTTFRSRAPSYPHRLINGRRRLNC